jgi:ferritin-like metal-binding protein YciE
MATINNLEELLVDQLRDLYNAEMQLTKALPKMAEAAGHAELRQAFEEHLSETQEHVARLERVFESLGQAAKGKTCHAMKGLVEEGSEAIKEKGPDAVRDAALIAAAQRVEHYEMAGYGTVRTFAEHLGHKEAAQLLQQTLEEESACNEKLTQLAESHINQHAMEGAGADGE